MSGMEAVLAELDSVKSRLEALRLKYEPLERTANRAVGAQMRVYDQMRDAERLIERLESAASLLRGGVA